MTAPLPPKWHTAEYSALRVEGIRTRPPVYRQDPVLNDDIDWLLEEIDWLNQQLAARPPADVTFDEPVPRADQPSKTLVSVRWWSPGPPVAGLPGGGSDPGGLIGAVLQYNTITGRYRAYLNRVPGLDRDADVQYIAQWGSVLGPAGRAMFPRWANEKWDGDND